MVAMYAAIAIIIPDPQSLKVFSSFWASGHAAVEGLNPFAAYPLTWIVEIPGPDIVDVNLNPPSTLPVFMLLSFMRPFAGAMLLSTISAAAFIVGCMWLKSRGADDWKIAWILTGAAMADSLLLGQIYAVIFALGLVIEKAWALGLLIALKPNFALALPVIFLAGRYRLAVQAGLFAGAVTFCGLIALGPQTTMQWLTALPADGHWIFPTTVSLPSYFQRLGLHEIGLALAAALGIGACLHAWIRKPENAVEIALIVAMLCSPLCWFHYTLVLMPSLAMQKWNRATAIGAAILWIPSSLSLLALRASPLVQATFGGMLTFGLLLLLAGQAYRRQHWADFESGALRANIQQEPVMV